MLGALYEVITLSDGDFFEVAEVNLLLQKTKMGKFVHFGCKYWFSHVFVVWFTGDVRWGKVELFCAAWLHCGVLTYWWPVVEKYCGDGLHSESLIVIIFSGG